MKAIPLVGIPFNLIDIGRDVGLFEEGGALDWLDFLDWFRLNKDNPNYVDKRTAEEKETDEPSFVKNHLDDVIEVFTELSYALLHTPMRLDMERTFPDMPYQEITYKLALKFF